MKTTTIQLLFGLSLATAGLGCGAGAAPEELHSARDAYAMAEKSQAPKVAPVKLEEAKQALARAEDAFKGGGEDDEIKTLAYVAQRKSEQAVSVANVEVAKAQVEQAESDKTSLTQTQLSQTKSALEAERKRAEEEQRRLDEAAKKGAAEVARVKEQLEAEK
jgi:hypothetical protein